MTAMIFAAAMVIVGNHAPARLVCTPAGAGQEIACKAPPRWICSPSGAGMLAACYEWTGE
ncbi:hypothetical protein CN233_03730 [Sinorhizobium meliloti]|uniref:hypothetical protein n=1 Tax=Rhizobium meliloti TaxID=382 RepID=UPI000FD8CE96|nr:hypothetical protein [Sinorhizobium meliloti]MDX0254258.1 hypothetical protein [Sinorhizobium meliloti]RVG38242.1 hypothetical protein CN233_03730 [Sinorhizobium meliloti]RVQ01318.1 hypothetical protein CN069_16015 [Sinorhizobium meliloti]WQP12793.1 hypothetical protein U8C30_27850 [Sinorhizobium meliloti]WQP26274.1 hypothetical protein U8C43_27800 [Sinorhizobium meliloti]